MLRIDLPRPISTNRLFRNKRQGRARTDEYNTWLWQAKAAIQSQKPIQRIAPPVRIMFAVGEIGLNSTMDGDNCLKCLLDALVENGVIPDDNRQHVRGVGMEWVEGKEGVTAYITPAARAAAVEVPIIGAVS